MAWQIPVGADVGGEGETSADDTFNAKSLDTLFFYPTKNDYGKAVKSVQLQQYLQAANYPSVCKYTRSMLDAVMKALEHIRGPCGKTID
jgi:hypothetical protein